MSKKQKQSLLTGALAGSFGIFISKALGLFYVVPLNNLAGNENMAFYSIAYTYYDLLLKITQAGVPFAIAALVAKYVGREDYKTALLVKKIGISFIMAFSFAVGVVFLLISRPLAKSSLGGQGTLEDIVALTTTLHILLLAVIVVPLLSTIRGYYQGLKRLDIFAASQVLEQFFRVFCIVAVGWFFVRVLKFDSIFAVYVAIFAAGLAAIITIIYLMVAAGKDNQEVVEAAKTQESEAKSSKEIFKEILSLGIPYIVISFLGTLAPLINSRYFLPYATHIGIDYVLAKKVLSIVLTNCGKIASIPQVLALGFSAGLVPYLSEIYEKKDYANLRRQLKEIFGTVLYILVPVVMMMALFSLPVYYVMYGNADLQLGAELLMFYCLVAFTDTVAPILSSIMITLRFRKNAIAFLLTGAVVKLLTFFLGISVFGYRGMILSTAISSFAVIALACLLLKRNFDFDIYEVLHIFMRTILCGICALTPIYLYQYFAGFSIGNRLLCLVELGISGVVMLAIYAFFTIKMHLPQEVFHIEDFSWKALMKKWRR